MSLFLAHTTTTPYTRTTTLLLSSYFQTTSRTTTAYHRCRFLHHLLQQQQQQQQQQQKYYTTKNHEISNDKVKNLITNNQQKQQQQQHQIPCFNLERSHFGPLLSNDDYKLSTPTSFHTYLINAINQSHHRITLASLYIGTGFHEKEAELLSCLREARRRGVAVTILLDENRALRRTTTTTSSCKDETTTTTTCSAAAVRESLNDEGAGLFLYNALSDERLWSRMTRGLLPNPLNEVAGVFHIKAYVIDDCLLLSGANLSEEYFTDRQDRHLLFTNGANGLVDFYQDLITTFCHHSSQYSSNAKIIPPSSSSSPSSSIEKSISDLYSRHYQSSSPSTTTTTNKNVIAHVIPTIQLPPHDNPLRHHHPSLFPSDVQIIRNLLTNTLHHHHHPPHRHRRRCLLLCSAYLNPTPSFLQLLLSCHPSPIHLLTAGPKSHGFKKGTRRWISTIFQIMARDLSRLKGVMVRLYEREGWTFHGKGLWIVDEQDEEEEERRRRLVATVVGSGNYGERSELLDVESHCVILLANDDGGGDDDKGANDDDDVAVTKQREELSEALLNDWDDFQRYATTVMETTMTTDERERKGSDGDDDDDDDWWIRLVIPFIKKFF